MNIPPHNKLDNYVIKTHDISTSLWLILGILAIFSYNNESMLVTQVL